MTDLDSFFWQSPADTQPKPPRDLPRRTRKRRLLIGCAAALITAAGLTVLALTLSRTTPVTVIIASDALQAQTHAGTVGDLLKEMGITLSEGDMVSPPPDSPITADLVVRVEKARSITLTVDGETRIFWTALGNPADILSSAGLRVGRLDRLLVDGTEARIADLPNWPVPVRHIVLRHAVPLHVDEDGRQRAIQTTGETVGEALFEAGFTLYLADAVTPGLNTPVSANLEVTIDRSHPVTITADGQTLQTRTQGSTVADALTDAGVALVGLDYTIPAEHMPLHPGVTIRVIRVREAVITEVVAIPFATIHLPDLSLPMGEQRMVQPGADGMEQVRIRVRYEDGVEVSRTTEDVFLVQPPVNRLIISGES